MNMVVALFLLQFVSGLCIDLVSIENYVRNNTLSEKNRNSTGKLSYQELTDNNEQPTRPRRIFKVFPVKTNQGWNKKFSIPPELQDLSQDVPVAIIVAAKTDLHNLKLKNESNVTNMAVKNNTTESKTHNVDVNNDSHIISNNPYKNNEVENQIVSNLKQYYVKNLQNVFTKASSHGAEAKEELYESNDVKETSEMNYENELEDSKEHNHQSPTPHQHQSDIETLGSDVLENEDDDNKDDHGKVTFTSLANGNLCNIDTKFLKPKCSTKEQQAVDIHKCLKISRHDPHKGDFNVFFIVKR